MVGSPPNSSLIVAVLGGVVRRVRVLDPPNALGPGQLVRQVTLEPVGPDFVAERQAVGRVAVLAIQRHYPDLDPGGRVAELGDVLASPMPLTAWTRVIGPWLLPPPYRVSSRKTEPISAPGPESR
jgi:hypothetical protein